MPTQPERNLFEYAVVRFVPSIERGEFVNVGLVMMCKRRRWLRCRFHIASERVLALFPGADIDLLRKQLVSFERISEGDTSPIGSLEAHERFRWLTAVRSACIATSRPHPGHAGNLESAFDTLFNELVV